MTQIGPAEVIQAPVLAAAPPLSLVAAARTGQGAGRWEAGGVTYVPEGCAQHGIIDPCSNSNFGPAQPINPGNVTGRPFIVWAADECSTFGFASRDWAARARRQLIAATPWEVEREFWMGTSAQINGSTEEGNRYLSQLGAVTDITPGGGAVSPLDGLACLEQALADTAYGAQGMIHITRKVAISLSQNGVLRRVGNTLQTDVDTVVVPGVGYPGTGPELPAPPNPVATPGTAGGATLANDTYEYVVTAVTANGESLSSGQAAATVTAGPTGKVDLTWSAVTGATGYRVYGRQAGSLVHLGSPTGTSFTDTGAAALDATTPPTADTSGASAAGEDWIYATDYVTVFLGDPVSFGPGEGGLQTEYGILDPSVNTLRYRAERTAAVTFDGCRHFGIRVTTASCGGNI